MSDPKPCPFCGSSDVGGAGGQVHCYSCPATIEVQNTNTAYAVELWNRRSDEITRLQSENKALQHKSDHCKREASQWRQEARTQSSIVAEIYEAVTGKKGEPGDWNGANPVKVELEALRGRVAEQEEQLDRPRISLLRERSDLRAKVLKLTKYITNQGAGFNGDHACAQCYPHSDILMDGFECGYHLAQRLRQQATDAEKAGGDQ